MIKKIIKSFFPINNQYQRDLIEVLNSIKNSEKLLTGTKLMDSHHRSKTFTEEFHFLKIYLSNGLEFYAAMALSFKDPLMSYIISIEHMDCLFHYVKQKMKFWSNYINQQLYSLMVLMVVSISTYFMKIIFSTPVHIFQLICIYTIVILVNYIVTICLIWIIYKRYCDQYMFLHYCEHKISLKKLLSFHKNENLLSLTAKLETYKLKKKEHLLDILNMQLKFFHYIPYIINIIGIFISLFYFVMNIIYIFQYTLANSITKII